MEEKYVLVSLEDEKAEKLANILGNKTCKKILNLLTEKEKSESEIAKELGMPLNTVDYNIKKLIKAGLIEEKKHLWSSKGKRISFYKVSNKYIIISPKKTYQSQLKTILPVVFVSAIFTAFVLWYSKVKNFVQGTVPRTEEAMITGAKEIGTLSHNLLILKNPIIWFLIVLWIGIVIYVILNLKSKKRIK